MLKYKSIRIIFFSGLLLIFSGNWLMGWHTGYLIIGWIMAYLSMISWGAYFIHSGFFLDAICAGKKNKREIAITFDDGPVKDVTPAVLDLLRAYHVKAAFFCIGKNIAGNEELLKRIKGEGHLLGNHSWSHSFFFDFFRDGRVEEELIHTNEVIEQLTGSKVIYFRPPYGVTNPVIARVVRKLKMPVIGWNVRSMDTTIKNQDVLFNRITSGLKPGDIVLFHDSHQRIIPVLKRFLEYARQHDFAVVGLDKLI